MDERYGTGQEIGERIHRVNVGYFWYLILNRSIEMRIKYRYPNLTMNASGCR